MTTIDAGAKAWLLKTAKSNYWRVAAWYEYSDLVQDGFMCWSRIVAHYETMAGRTRSKPLLMSLFKRTYSNHIHDLSKGILKEPKQVGIMDLAAERRVRADAEYIAWDAADVEGDAYSFERMVSEAPSRLQRLLRALMSDGPSEALLAAFHVRLDGTRETTNERLCKLIGADPQGHDYATDLRSFLRHAV